MYKWLSDLPTSDPAPGSVIAEFHICYRYRAISGPRSGSFTQAQVLPRLVQCKLARQRRPSSIQTAAATVTNPLQTAVFLRISRLSHTHIRQRFYKTSGRSRHDRTRQNKLPSSPTSVANTGDKSSSVRHLLKSIFQPLLITWG